MMRKISNLGFTNMVFGVWLEYIYIYMLWIPLARESDVDSEEILSE